MEHYGAVFLPNAGDRIGTDPVNVGSFGLYWAGGKQSTTVYDVLESSTGYFMVYSSNPNLGFSVRLVRDVQ